MQLSVIGFNLVDVAGVRVPKNSMQAFEDGNFDFKSLVGRIEERKLSASSCREALMAAVPAALWKNNERVFRPGMLQISVKLAENADSISLKLFIEQYQAGTVSCDHVEKIILHILSKAVARARLNATTSGGAGGGGGEAAVFEQQKGAYEFSPNTKNRLKNLSLPESSDEEEQPDGLSPGTTQKLKELAIAASSDDEGEEAGSGMPNNGAGF